MKRERSEKAGFKKPVVSSARPPKTLKTKYPKTMGSFPLATVSRGQKKKKNTGRELRRRRNPPVFKNKLHRSLYSFLLFLVYLLPTQTTAPPSPIHQPQLSLSLSFSRKNCLDVPQGKTQILHLIVYYLLH